MPSIRVVLTTMPRLLGDIVRETLACQPDIEVLDEVADCSEIGSAVQRTRADVVIAAIPADAPRHFPDDLLRAHSRLKMIALTEDGRTAYVYELRPHETAIREISPQALLQAIRSSTQ